MSDLREHFRSLENLSVPDLRGRIVPRPPPRERGSRRIVAGVIALALTAAGALVARRAFLPDSPDRPRDVSQPAPADLDPRVVAEIPLSHHAIDIAAAGGDVWVALLERDGSPESTDYIAPVEAATNGLGRLIAIGPEPRFLDIGHGSVWVVSNPPEAPDLLKRVDPATHHVTATLEFPEQEYVQHFAIGERLVWAVTRDPASDEARVVGVDPVSVRVVAQIPLRQPGIDWMTVGDGNVWLADFASPLVPRSACANVIRIDEATLTLTDIGVASPPSRGLSGGLRIAPGLDAVWVNCRTEGDQMVIRRVDSATGEVGIPLDLPARFAAPLGETADGLWLRAFDAGDRVEVILVNPENGRTAIAVDDTNGGDFGGVVDVANDAIWVPGANSIERIDLHR